LRHRSELLIRASTIVILTSLENDIKELLHCYAIIAIPATSNSHKILYAQHFIPFSVSVAS
ncbi:hypothetical protein, partial [Eshraghiella crossota]|uniref:hypothetical protein n=1 Tax=Eshraghiella crossota TaxID=45851 RepID=UPI003FD70695